LGGRRHYWRGVRGPVRVASVLPFGDPRPPFVRLRGRVDADLGRDQKAQRLDRVAYPAHIGDEGDPLPRLQLQRGDVEVFPGGAGKTAFQLVVETQTIVPLAGFHNRGNQHAVALADGDAPGDDECDDIVRKPVDDFDHWGAPRSAAPIAWEQRDPPARGRRVLFRYAYSTGMVRTPRRTFRSAPASGWMTSPRGSSSPRSCAGPTCIRGRWSRTRRGSRSGWRERSAAPCSPRQPGPRR